MSLLDPRVWLVAVFGMALAYGGGRWQQYAHDKAVYAAERTKAALSAAVPIPVIASGGISSIADLEALCLESKISGAIVGRALYDGRIDLKEALAIAAEHRPPASDGAG